MKTLFDLKEYGIEMIDMILTDMVVQGDDVTKERIYQVMENWFISKFGKKELGIGNVLTVKVNSIIGELEEEKMIRPHGNMYALTRKGKVVQKVSYKVFTTKNKPFIQRIKDFNLLVSSFIGIAGSLLYVIMLIIAALCALGILSVSDQAKEWMQLLR